MPAALQASDDLEGDQDTFGVFGGPAESGVGLKKMIMEGEAFSVVAKDRLARDGRRGV